MLEMALRVHSPCRRPTLARGAVRLLGAHRDSDARRIAQAHRRQAGQCVTHGGAEEARTTLAGQQREDGLQRC
jgi:hypothetical protein